MFRMSRVLTGATIALLAALLSGCNLSINISNTSDPSVSSFTVGGTMSGLASGQSVVLQNNGGDDLTVSSDGGFQFATALPTGSSYAVTVRTQPTGQTCQVSNGTGTIGTSNVTNVQVTCTIPLAYTADYNNSLIQAYSIHPATGVPSTTPIATTTDTGGTKYVTVDDSGSYLYAVEPNNQTVTAFRIDKTTGALTRIGSPVATSAGTPTFVTVNPVANVVYVLVDKGMSTAGSIDTYPIQADGSLGARTSISSVAAKPFSMVLNKTATHAYLAYQSGFVGDTALDPNTGIPNAPSSYVGGFTPYSVTLNPDETYLYAVDAGTNAIQQCPLNSSSGQIQTCNLIGNAGPSARGIVFDSTGSYAYIVNGGTGSGNDGSITEYSVNQTNGQLTLIGTVTGVGNYANSIHINSAGTIVYVVNNWGPPIAAYRIDSTTGLLSPIGTAQFGVGSNSANSLAFTQP